MSTFKDPFAGTPKAATHRVYGVNNESPLEKARRGIIFEKNSLFGMMDIDGTELYPTKYYYIGRCRSHVLFIEPDGSYLKLSPGCTESGYMPKEKRPYVKNGKVGFKVGRKILIPAEYDYIRSAFGDNSVFLVTKDGREYYINENGKEVLSRVRTFDGEELNGEPFWLRTNEFDYFTVMNYIGHEDESNPNVVKINDKWVELDRFSKDEILNMIVDPGDDLPIRAENIGILCDKFSYEYSFYIANASGAKPLEKCFEQFSNMGAFDSSWYFTVKLWQAPNEHVSAEDLRMFRQNILHQKVIGSPAFAVGHDDTLQPGEVRMLLVTNYNERCFPPSWEFEWGDKCRKLPITELCKEVPALKKHIEEDIYEEYREDDFHGLIDDCLEELNYKDGLNWEDTLKALDYFLELGSDVKNTLIVYASKGRSAALAGNTERAMFFLRAAQWALKQGATINKIRGNKSVLDHVDDILARSEDEASQAFARSLRNELVAKGAVTYKERIANTDYYKELDYLNA